MNGRLAFGLKHACVVAFVIAGFFAPALATEGGQSSTLRGYRDFSLGVLPPPGLIVREDLYHYRGTERSTVPQGQLRVDLKAVATILAVTAVTPYQVLGGNYAFAVRFAASNAIGDQSVTRPGFASVRGGSLHGLNDIVLTPVIVGWHHGNFHWNFGTSVWMPAGDYDKNRAVNTGKNYWSMSPQIGMTYFDPTSGWDISGGIGYVYSIENTATNYRSGNLTQIEFAVGKVVVPHVKLGVAGYTIQQLDGDSGTGATLGDRKMRVMGIGPVAALTVLVNNVPVNVTLKYYREFNAQNTTQGDAGSMSLRVRF